MPRPLSEIYSDRTYIMGVLNVTPDSFFDKGRFFNRDKAVHRGLNRACEGADIIDIGGESTRPGAKEVNIDEELNRVLPVVEAISKKIKIPISIDTRKSEVAETVLKAGANIVNDVSALNYDPKMAGVVAKYKAAIILMHMKGTPQDMQINPTYDDVVKEIILRLKESIDTAEKSGIAKDKIIIDPGIGFGKTVEHNLEILNRLDEFKALGRSICIGTSRKSFIGKILGSEDPQDRLAGTLATYAIAIMKGANILRVHDVKEAIQAARITDSIAKKRAG